MTLNSNPLTLTVLALTIIASPSQAASVKTERILAPTATSNTATGAGSIPTEDLELDLPGQTLEGPSSADNVAPTIHYGDADLPRPVARMRDALLEAAYTGEIERLRPVLEMNEMPPTLSFTPIGDPIEFLKSASGDPYGVEILAILTETLEAGWVHVDKGEPQEMYIWPYFARYPLHHLSPSQKVEMYRIITANDFAEMELNGAWTFYRIGIAPDGTLHYFVAGD